MKSVKRSHDDTDSTKASKDVKEGKRNRTPTKVKRPKKSYDGSDLMNALNAVKDGKYNITNASKFYNVPRQTLADKVKGKSPATFCRPGPHPLLGIEIEEKLKNWAIQNTESGFITTKDSILFSVQRGIEQNFEPHIQQYFKTRSLGTGWYKAFKKRYPDLVLKKLETCFSYTPVNKTEIRTWFRKVRKQLGKNAEILIDPERIFCMGELILALNPPVRKNNYLFSDKENVMVLFASNAEAKFAPPMINFKYNSATSSTNSFTPNECQVTYTTTGKMNSLTFYQYFVNGFYPHLLKCNVEFPIVLFLDARIAHISLPLHEFCQEKGILLVSLLPNAINVLHPFESGFFHLFKEMWKTEVKFWPARNNNVNIKEENVETVVTNIMQFTEFSSTMQKAFRKCGLFPFDMNVVDCSNADQSYPRVLKKTIDRWNTSQLCNRPNIQPETNKHKHDEVSINFNSSIDDSTAENFIIEDYIVEVEETMDNDDEEFSKNFQYNSSNSPSKELNESFDVKENFEVTMAENGELDLNINAEDIVATPDDNQEVIRKKNKDLQSLLEKVIDLLKEKTNVCLNLEKQNSALNLQISSLKDIVSITKNLLSIRNMEVENMQKDMSSLHEKITAEKERHNKMIETVGSANKLSEDIKGEYQNQMGLFQQLREKYNEKVALLMQENQKLKTELQTLKVQGENEKNENESQ